MSITTSVAVFDWSDAGARDVSLAAMALLDACPIMTRRLDQLSDAIIAAVRDCTNVAYMGEARDAPFRLCDAPSGDEVAFYRVQPLH